MAVMFGAMAFMRRVDQEEPLVLLYARLAYVTYILATAFVYVLLHLRIVSRRDVSLIRVPLAAKPPSFSDAMAAAQTDDKNDDDQPDKPIDEPQKDEQQKPTDELITVMEYDLRKLAAARKSFVSNACLLAAIHYKMESVSPLVMSSLMGITRLLSDDPLFQIHLRGAPAVGPLSRPFTPPKNPLADMLKDLQPKPDDPPANSQNQNEQLEDLHDDGDPDDDEHEDAPPPNISDLKDDHIKGDFDDEEHHEKDKDT